MQPAPPPPPPVQASGCNKIDFLFVVDDSYSMFEEQTNLTSNFPKFLQAIDSYVTASNELLDYRLAVTTTGVSTAEHPDPNAANGALRGACGITRQWVERTDLDVEQAFSCRATVGLDGPYTEMPVRSVELALSDRITDGTNAGFLREDALLAIIILTDEDDCTDFEGVADAECHVDMADHVTFLDSLTGDRSRWAMSVIAGDMDCNSSFGSAEEAARLKQLIGLAGDNGVFSSICEGDLSPALTDALDTFSAACDDFEPIE